MEKILLGTGFLLSFGAFAQLPSDLQRVANVFNSIAIDELEQDEYQLTLDDIQLTATDYLIPRVMAEESARLVREDAPTPDIDTLKISNIQLSQNATDPTSNFLNAELLARRIYTEDPQEEYAPYFCGALKINEDSGEPLSENCLRELNLLTQEIQSLGLETALVEFVGNEWGVLKYNVLYVRSREDETQVLKMYFDVLHEI